MVGVAQLVEHRVVIPGVAGSSPVAHPIGEEAPIDPIGASFRSRRPALPRPTLPYPRLMRLFSNLVSYGLAAGAALCLSVALAKPAIRSRKTRAKRG